jgi:formate dehydrogenase beta subunit
MPAGYELAGRCAPPAAELGRRTGISEVETGYTEAATRRQAERCLACHVQTVYDPDRCVLCGRCVDVCPEHCLRLVPLEELELGAAMAAALEFYHAGGKRSAMLKDDEKCLRCGLCAIRCPTDAMSMEVFRYEERHAVA